MKRSTGNGSNSGLGTQAYGEAWYWDKRYSQHHDDDDDDDTVAFDWYQKYPSLAPLFHLYIPPLDGQLHLLVVGCGDSALSEDMVNDGYCNIFNVDISAVVIQAMQKKYSSWPQLKFMQMDVRDMSAFEAGSFDALIDKGTLDSILCGGDSQENAGKMLKEVERVLKDGGIYFLITYGAPKYRLNLLRNSYPWTIKLHVIDKFSSSESSKHKASDLTSPVLLDDNSSSLDSVLGKNREVHYIYVCMKDKKHMATT